MSAATAGVPPAAAYYLRRAAQYLIDPSAGPVPLEAFPAAPGSWPPPEPGSLGGWLAAIGSAVRGALGQRLRSRDAAGAACPAPPRPRLELYLDVSGSLPDPCSALNTRTLAAFVLAMSAIRAGAPVMPVLDAGHALLPAGDGWATTLPHVATCLLHHMGGMALFPYQMLEELVALNRDDPPYRVVLCDGDLLHQLDLTPAAPGWLQDTVAGSTRVIALLFAGGRSAATLERTGVEVVPIDAVADFPTAAARIAARLYGLP